MVRPAADKKGLALVLKLAAPLSIAVDPALVASPRPVAVEQLSLAANPQGAPPSGSGVRAWATDGPRPSGKVGLAAAPIVRPRSL